MCEALIPLLEFSDSPRIVNVSSSTGKLEVGDTNCLYLSPCLESQSGSHLFLYLEVVNSLYKEKDILSLVLLLYGEEVCACFILSKSSIFSSII